MIAAGCIHSSTLFKQSMVHQPGSIILSSHGLTNMGGFHDPVLSTSASSPTHVYTTGSSRKDKIHDREQLTTPALTLAEATVPYGKNNVESKRCRCVVPRFDSVAAHLGPGTFLHPPGPILPPFSVVRWGG